MAAEREEQPRRIIQKVTVTYRLPGDPRDKERTFTLAHSGDGELIDGLIWNRGLIRKLAYRQDAGRYEDVKTGSAGREWKLDLKRASDNCMWVHDYQCRWYEVCGPDDDDV